jgi:hypothetical protein
MIKLFAFLMLRNTTQWNTHPKPIPSWTVIDKNRNMPFINTIRIKPFFSPDGEEYIIVETCGLDRPKKLTLFLSSNPIAGVYLEKN